MSGGGDIPATTAARRARPGLNPKAAIRHRAAETERARAAWLIASDLASRAFGADVRVVMQTRGTVGRGGSDAVSKARKVACYLAQVVADCSGQRLAEASGLDRATIHVHAAWVEDQRDDPAFDAVVQALETALFSMAARVVLARLGEAAPDLGEAA